MRIHSTLISCLFLAGCAGCGGSDSDGSDPTAIDSGTDARIDATFDAPTLDVGDTAVPKDTAASDSAVTSDVGDVLADATSDDSSDGDSLVTADTASDAADGCVVACIASKVTWGNQGGLVPFVETSSLSPCRSYTHERRRPGTKPVDKTCTQDVEACVEAMRPNAGDVRRALSDPDMIAALSAAPVLYGRDTRAVDGSVFVLTYDAKEVTIGADCGADPACTPIPSGVKKAMTTLQKLDTVQLATGSCGTVFP